MLEPPRSPGGGAGRPVRAEGAARALGVVVAAAAGLLAGVVGSFLQAWTLRSAPLGLALALLAVAAASSLGGRLAAMPGATAAAAGWVLAVLVLLWPRREGDVVLAATGAAYAYLFCGLLVCAVGLAVARVRDSRTGARPPMQDR